MRVTVITADERVLGDSHSDPARMVNHKTEDRPEVLAALAGKPGRHLRQSEMSVRETPRIFDVLVSPLAPGAGKEIARLVVVRDVTDLMRTAAVKAEFVANAPR
jgi:hypothetical protein